MEFCGEIQYIGEYYDHSTKKMEEGGIHSDICHHRGERLNQDDINFLHECLDEWIRKSKGTGFFWVGNPEEIANNFRKDEE